MANVRAGRVAAMSVGAALTLVACMSDGGARTETSPSNVASPSRASSSAALGRIVFVRGSLDGSAQHVFTIEP
jgi:hypothetical protein